MSEVLIVGKTRKRNSACIGGLLYEDGRSVRMHKANGADQPLDTSVEIGQVWDIEFVNQQNLHPPHTENINVTKGHLVRTETNLKDILTQTLQVPVTNGSPLNLYQGLVHSTGTGQGSLYIGTTQVPNYSTTFWIPDASLVHTGKHYNYGPYKLAWVGFADPIDIPVGTLVRVSLAGYYQPDFAPPGYYLQLSGWFL